MNFIELIPLRFEPRIVTEVPTSPLPGEKPVMDGNTVKGVALVAVPTELATLIEPVVAPTGTVAVNNVLVPWVNWAGVPLKRTEARPSRFVPETKTLTPASPSVGLKSVMVGAIRKEPLLVAVPPGVVTLNFPEVAPWGIVTVITTAVVTTKATGEPFSLTAEAPVKFLPVS